MSRPSIAFLGPLGTYSHQVAVQYFGRAVAQLPCETIADVFALVERAGADYGVVPIDNSTVGPVLETQHRLRTTRLSTRDLVALPVKHALLGSKQRQATQRIVSHEQGLGQCEAYLRSKYPSAKLEAVPSTSAAAVIAKDDPTALAVCSIMCAEVYNLDIIDSSIQDAGKANTTRFLIVSDPERTLPSEYPVALTN